MDAPSTNGSNGPTNRSPGGRFAKGNAGGPGNPFAAKVARLRKTMLASVTPADMREVVAALLAKAKSGDVAAVRELLERTLGKPQEADLMERMEKLEALLNEKGGA
jgi:hypothetical protein